MDERSPVSKPWSRVRTLAALVVAGSAVALLSGCGSTALHPSRPGASASGAPTGSASPSPPTSIPTGPTQYATQAPAKSGGSSVRLLAPCDGGTLTLKAFPLRSGVAMTATLRHTTHKTWWFETGITPEPEAGGDMPGTKVTARDGTVRMSADNLTASNAVNGLNHAWPQSAGVDLSTGTDVDCGSRVYLDARKAQVVTPDMQVHVSRSGVLVVEGDRPAGGTWQVTASVQAPSGAQHRTRAVTATKNDYVVANPYDFNAKLKGLTRLRDFTSLTVTVSKDGQHRTWLVLTRTP